MKTAICDKCPRFMQELEIVRKLHNLAIKERDFERKKRDIMYSDLTRAEIKITNLEHEIETLKGDDQCP